MANDPEHLASISPLTRPGVGRHAGRSQGEDQKEDGHAYAARKGWTVVAVYEDDAISGKYGEEHRPGLKALLAAAEQTPRPFDVVIMAKDDRLMRNQWQLAVVLSRLYEAGVRLVYYQEDREVSLDDATGRFMEQVRGYASEAYRESQTRHMIDALKRKAKAGHVHGGRVFGYDNVRVDGHVERRINAAEAAVVETIFTSYGRGTTPKQIAAALTAAGAPTPGKAGGWRGAAWTKGSVREVLLRELYRGAITSRWGAETIRLERPELRIIADDLWTTAQRRLAEQRAVYLRHTDGKLWGRPANSVESQYLLTGLLTCAACGSGLTVVSRHHGRKRAHFYACLANIRGRRRGPHCSNTLPTPMAVTDQVVLTLIEATILRPEIISATIAEALRRLQPDQTAARRRDLERDVRTVERELANLTRAIKAGGGAIETLVTEVKACEARQRSLREGLDALARDERFASVDLAAIETDLRARLQDWRGLLGRHVGAARQLLRKLIPDRLVFTPHVEGERRWYEFEGVGRLEPLLRGLVPAGTEAVLQDWWPQRD